jgi:transcription antitermination factor NusG
MLPIVPEACEFQDSPSRALLATSTLGTDEGPGDPVIQPWRVLLINPRHASLVEKDLKSKGYEEYLPTFKETRKWHDRKVELDVPLFRGYLFARFDFEDRLRILETFGVVRILTCLSQPALVTEAEIETIRAMLESGLPCSSTNFKIGQKVEIICGPLVGRIGILTKFKGKDQWGLVVNIEMMGRGVGVPINREWARPLSK